MEQTDEFVPIDNLDHNELLVSYTDKQIDDETFVCPITCETIKKFGFTCFGCYYEYNAIKKWTEKHHTDPLTGLHLPDKTIITFDRFVVIKNIKECQEKVKYFARSQVMPKSQFYFISKDKSDSLKKVVLSEEENKTRRMIFEYMLEKKLLFELYANSIGGRKTSVEIKGKIYNGIDQNYFRKVDLSNMTITNTELKSFSFDGCDLSNTKFIESGLSRVSYVEANLNKTKFVKCNMIGEQVSFVDSIGKPMFIGAPEVEYMNWVQPETIEEVRDILHMRGLKDFYIV